jgi:hypothetical protein
VGAGSDEDPTNMPPPVVMDTPTGAASTTIHSPLLFVALLLCCSWLHLNSLGSGF